MATIHIIDIESAINYWLHKTPSLDGFSLSPELIDLAAAYDLMTIGHPHVIEKSALPPRALAAWLIWYATNPDTPCIAI
jgi:hypothetical protein